MQKSKIYVIGFFRQLLTPLVLFVPIWFAPIRTAPLEAHATALAIAVTAGFIYYKRHRKTMARSSRRMLLAAFGLAIGVVISGLLVWFFGAIAGVPDELRISGLYFSAALTWWFFLARRMPEKKEKARADA